MCRLNVYPFKWDVKALEISTKFKLAPTSKMPCSKSV